MSFKPYRIYRKVDPSISFDFDKFLGSGTSIVNRSKEQNRLELRTFGRTPYVYYAGHTDYLVFDLSTVLLSKQDDYGEVEVPAHIYYQQLNEMLNHRDPVIVETPLGEKIVCDVSLNPVATPYLYDTHQYDIIEVSVHCVEIGDD